MSPPSPGPASPGTTSPRSASAAASPASTTRVRVWDLPTRLFHWALAASVTASLASAWIGGNAMNWHFRFGYVAFALLGFRLAWGLVGGHWSRFASFVYAPATTWRYLRGASRPHEHHHVGHSPLGALSVFGLLGLLAVQVATGLYADDEIAVNGPLVKYVSGATSLALTKWHNTVGQWGIVAMSVLHVLAILYYRAVQKRDLIGPMLHGDKLLDAPAPAAVDSGRSRLAALLLLTASAAVVWWVTTL